MNEVKSRHRKTRYLPCPSYRSGLPADVFDFLRVRRPWNFDLLPMGYLALDRAGIIVDTNRMATRILDCSKKDLAGRDFFTLLDPEDLKIMEKSGYRLQDLEIFSQINLRIQKDSGKIWIKAFVVETDFSEQQALSLIFTDISNQKQTEKELGWQLRVTKEIDAITDAIAQPDPDYGHISRMVLTAAADLTQSANGFIATLPETFQSSVEMVFEQIYPDQNSVGTSILLPLNGSNGLVASALSSAITAGKPFFSTTSGSDSATQKASETQIRIHGALAVPLLLNHRPRKVLLLANPAAPYSQEMVKLLTRVAKLYTIALKLELSGG